MKNNRTKLNESQTKILLRNLGDPSLIAGKLDIFTSEETHSIIELDISKKTHILVYETLKNDHEKFEVLQEKDFGGTGSYVRIRYVRKGIWTLDLPPDLANPSSMKSSRSSKKKEEEKKEGEAPIIGFGAAVSKPKPAKKKIPAKKKKAPVKKKAPAKRKAPAKKKSPVRKKKAVPRKRSSRSSGAR